MSTLPQSRNPIKLLPVGANWPVGQGFLPCPCLATIDTPEGFAPILQWRQASSSTYDKDHRIYCINTAAAMAKSGYGELGRIKLAPFLESVSSGRQHIDLTHAVSGELSDGPPFVVIEPDGSVLLIDGNHRAFRHALKGNDEMEVLAFTAEQSDYFRVNNRVVETAKVSGLLSSEKAMSKLFGDVSLLIGDAFCERSWMTGGPANSSPGCVDNNLIEWNRISLMRRLSATQSVIQAMLDARYRVPAICEWVNTWRNPMSTPLNIRRPIDIVA
jgi:hypothetical protein